MHHECSHYTHTIKRERKIKKGTFFWLKFMYIFRKKKASFCPFSSMLWKLLVDSFQADLDFPPPFLKTENFGQQFKKQKQNRKQAVMRKENMWHFETCI